MIQVALFDLGGVLCVFDAERRTNAIALASGRAPAEVAAVLSPRVLQLLDQGEMDEAVLLAHVASGLAWECTGEELANAWCAAFRPRADVIGLLTRLAVPAGILTNNGPPLAGRFAALLPAVARVVAATTFSSDLGVVKPDPQAFVLAWKMLNVDPHAVVFVDDTPAHVHGARAAGLDAIDYMSIDQLAAELERRDLIGST
jgi:putative hydrolase of the HAD superfamily